VSFGGIEAFEVAVVSATRLVVKTPAGTPDTPLDVVVKNLDDDEDPIAGESVTLPSGFSFRRPALDATRETTLTSLSRRLRQDFHERILANTKITSHTDYDADGIIPVDPADLPALVLAGPRLFRRRALEEHQPVQSDLGGGESWERRCPMFFDVGYTVEGISGYTIELQNLMHVVALHFHRDPWVQWSPNPASPSDVLICPVMWDSEPAEVRIGGNSNIRIFRGAFRVVGVEIHDQPQFSGDLVHVLHAQDIDEVDSNTSGL